MTSPADRRLQRRLQETLAGLAAAGAEPGGAACVVRPGEVVASATIGTVDGSRPWTADTLVMCYSVAKPMAALAVLSVVAEGRLGLDDRVADVWPAYAASGKAATTVRHVLAHQAGLPCFPPPAAEVPYDDRAALLALLAAAEPVTPPGAAVAEHALTYGHLCGALVQEVAGERLHDRFAVLARRFGWDLRLSVPAGEQGRVATVVPVAADWPGRYLDDPRWGPALGRPRGLLDPGELNSARWRATPFEAVSLHGSAEGVARFQWDAVAADGPVAELLGPDLHAEYLAPQATGHDGVLDRLVTWTLGFQVEPDGDIGMGGAGGCSGWTAPRRGYAAAYVSRGLGDHARSGAVYDAIEAAVDETLDG